MNAVVTCLLSVALGAGFSIQDDDAGKLTILDDGKPVLVYNYGMVAPPEGVDEKYTRSSYVHPVYGLDGEVLTQDYPRDHYHQRGVFWAWPEAKVGDAPFNNWEMSSCKQYFEEFLNQHVEDDFARIVVMNAWKHDEDGEVKAREAIMIKVHPADEVGRAIDFAISIRSTTEEPLSLLGATGKGYGGFCFRPSAERKPMIFTAIDGQLERDALEYDTPWADVSFHLDPGGPMAGAAIFQHPSNPGYPHHGWIMRGYALLGAAWPHVGRYVLAPDELLTLRYRLFIHRGNAEDAGVASRFDAFIEEVSHE